MSDQPSTPHINRPGQAPRNPAAQGAPFSISRSRFLDNSNYLKPASWSMFMPGQSGMGSPPGNYRALPTVWPQAGAPLRVPKCVYLTSFPPPHLWGDNFVLMSCWNSSQNGYLGHYDDATARDTRTWMPDYAAPTRVPAGSLLFDGFVGGYEYIGWTIDPHYDRREEHRRGWRRYTTVPNPIVAEHNRLLREFAAAKTYLESTYPDHVFVEICDFFPLDPVTAIAPRDGRMPLVLDVYTPDGIAQNTPGMYANGPLWLLGPDSVQYQLATRTSTAPFFGSDFLHIYCGYQAAQGAMTLDGWVYRPIPTVTDMVNTFVFDTVVGYKLNTDPLLAATETSWITVNYDGYETGTNGGIVTNSYDEFFRTTVGLMVQSTTFDPGGPNERKIPHGKLDCLNIGWRNFSDYHVSLHEYDLSFNFGDLVPRFTSGYGINARMPPHNVNYEDQDWVEQYAFNYADVVTQYGSGAPWHDKYFPGADGTGFPGTTGHSGKDATGDQAGGQGGGGTFNSGASYNFSVRFPDTGAYESPGGYNDQLAAQYYNLKAALTNAGPRCAALWQDLIATYRLDTLGFTYDGGSSTVTAQSIIAYVENHYGLTPPD